MIEEIKKPKFPCEMFDERIEEKVSNLVAEGKEVPEHLMYCYTEMKKMKETKREEELI